MIDDVRASYLRADFPDDLRSAEDDLLTRHDRDGRIGHFLEPVWVSLYKIRQEILPHLGDQRVWHAFRLGERFDQAVAPAHTERRLYDPEGDDNTRLTNVDWWPGDQPPEPGCLEDVRRLAAELGLTPVCLAQLVFREEAAFTEAVMERAAGAVREGLRILAESAKAPADRPRIEVNLDRSVVLLDGESYQVRELGAVYVHALLDMKGEWLSRREARKGRPEFEHERHLERLLKTLPKPILAAIETTSRGSRVRGEYPGRPSH